ncbi:MAG: UDP-2,3-diacylglucosamine diphosphatase LpxI [Synergistaceae bacterium]|nr:UDP-2,3-diacylglucosamine diphosphatase LpxI [Synergistaceae bacterium]
MPDNAQNIPRKSAIIAGEGVLPVEIAKRLSQGGDPPLVLTLRSDGETFRGIADPLVRLSCPSLSRVIKEIRRHGAQSVIMAGRVPKKLIYLPALFDPLVLKLLTRRVRDDHSLLAAIVEILEEAGIPVLPYRQILPEFMAPEGQLSHRPPTAGEVRDFEYGASVLKVTLPCSFGQALVVADGAVVAVEAMEGTDATIQRAGNLVAKGVLVKMMRVDQDPRYDLPTVGPDTIENMARAGLTCLAVEARRTLVLDAEKTFALAERRDIALWGLPCQCS